MHNHNNSMKTIFKMTKNGVMMMAMVAFSLLGNAQAILPTSWNFDVTAPEGWTESLQTGTTRYAGGQVGQACKLDQTNDYVMLHFAEEPGALSYYLKGQNSGGAWQGTFTIEESADGGSYTALHTYVNGDTPTSAFTQFSDMPAASTRYIRFYYTNKVSGHNMGLDEVTLGVPTASAAQEINITQGASNVPSGFTYSIGNAASTTFTIENVGLSTTLGITSIELSGADAAQFSISGIPTTVAAGSSADFTLDFTPAGTGSRFATITVTNDDATESSYVINIYAIAGSLASEPTASATSLTFPNLESYDFNVSFNAATPAADSYVVLRKKGSPVTEMPTDGNAYVKGQWIGGSQVVYVGDAGIFNSRSVELGTTYHFAVFSENGPMGYQNYLTTSSLTGSVTTPGTSIGSTYSGVDHTSPAFVSQLTSAMNPGDYFQIYYSNYINTLITNFYAKDTVVGGQPQNYVECQYSGFPYVYPSGFQWSGSGDAVLSREHAYPQSWMPTYFDADFDDSPAVSDLHNLHPVLQDDCNAVRSNYPYGEVVAASTTFMETSRGTNGIGQTVYEMQPSFKGNAARSIMYHAVKNNTAENDFSLPEQISLTIPYGQDEYVLKQWHFNDLPDSYEKTRNEYIESEQHNRNAFIDSITFPCYIRFSNLTKWQPQFTVSGALLTAVDPGMNYQWSLNGAAIDGANSSTYTATQTGTYSVAVQQFSQCPTIASQGTSVTVIGVDELSNNVTASFYPNPSNGAFTVNVSSKVSGPVQVRISDIAGKLVHSTNHIVVTGDNKFDLNLNVPAGIYTAEIVAGGTKQTSRIIIK